MGVIGNPAGRRRSRLSKRAVELMVAITIAGVFLLIAGPYLYRLWKREKLRIAVTEVYALVAASRLHAVRRDRLEDHPGVPQGDAGVRADGGRLT